jgi:hypothetical protein
MEQEQKDEASFVMCMAWGILVLVVALLCCNCSTGGYLQVGYIPVTQVNDQHGHNSKAEGFKRSPTQKEY